MIGYTVIQIEYIEVGAVASGHRSFVFGQGCGYLIMEILMIYLAVIIKRHNDFAGVTVLPYHIESEVSGRAILFGKSYVQ